MKIKLFTAVQISRQIASKANLEARYYEYLKKAQDHASKPNNALLGIVNALRRLELSAERLGYSDIKKAIADGFFDATLDEYRKHTGNRAFQSAKEKLDKERESVISSLSALGKPMEAIENYFAKRLEYDVLPMQAFEKLASSIGLIESTEIAFGEEFHGITIREYNISKAIRMYNSGINGLIKDKSNESAARKITEAKVIFNTYNMTANVIDGKVVISGKQIEQPKAKAKQQTVNVM